MGGFMIRNFNLVPHYDNKESPQFVMNPEPMPAMIRSKNQVAQETSVARLCGSVNRGGTELLNLELKLL